MTIYSFHLFDRNCDPQITHHFHAPNHALKELDAAKLLFGTLHSLRHLTKQLSSNDDDDDGFISYKTSHYALFAMETPSRLRFVLLSSVDMAPAVAKHVLGQVYASLYIEYCVKNPLSLVALYNPSQRTLLETHRFGPAENQTRAQKKRREEISKREKEGDGGQVGRGTGQDLAMVMGCELFILALEQFMQQLPGYD